MPRIHIPAYPILQKWHSANLKLLKFPNLCRTLHTDSKQLPCVECSQVAASPAYPGQSCRQCSPLSLTPTAVLRLDGHDRVQHFFCLVALVSSMYVWRRYQWVTGEWDWWGRMWTVNTNTNRAPIHNNVGTCTQICIHTWIYIVCSICCLLCNVVKQRSSATYVMSALGCRPKTSGVSTRGRWSITSLNNSMDLPGWCCSPCRRHRTPGTCALQTTPRDTICIHYECQTWLSHCTCLRYM